ncbi:hypothetical protein [Ketobacter sp.]|uniref:hypothetical protein n=1 Tax=Ketobacter sp. TaxID=2083498 RepID=UPI000F2A4B5E|nr:hypothetical protein [Ketobacter sp.]RLU00680.1 MAG: hypothetical protein D9N14_05275 [Ketobacter sp.]
MLRFVSSAVILTVLLVVFVGRCHYNTVSVGALGSVYDAVSTVAHVKQLIDRYYYDHQQLPGSNLELRQPDPLQFGRRAALLKQVEVLPGGILYAVFTAENKERNVELVFTPETDGKYRLKWQCTSYNLTEALREALLTPCADSDAPFDREHFARQEAIARSADTYLEQVTAAQRQITPTQVETVDCSPLQTAADDFLHITADQLSYWTLSPQPELQYQLPRPEGSPATAYWAVRGKLYLYQGSRLAQFDADRPAGISSRVNLLQPHRFRRQGELLLADSGIGITRIDLCPPQPKIRDNYLLELGAYNQIRDFILDNGLVYLTAQEAQRTDASAALQVVSLRSNRPLGFLKLEGQGGGIALSGRRAFVANGSHGIALVDVFDPTIPRLLKRVATMDFASDLLLHEQHLLVADRLAGLRVYRLTEDSLVETQVLTTDGAAIQLQEFDHSYVGVRFKDGTSALYQWQDNKVTPVALHR